MAGVQLYDCRVMHRRYFPLQYRFDYRIYSLLIDIDRLDEVHKTHPWLSVNRFNLLSFYASDHLLEGHTNLRDWCDSVLQAQGQSAAARVYLLSMPRVLGRVFNPLSLWFCEDQQGRPLGVIAEVRNTFGERHCYWLAARDGQQDWPLLQQHAKNFYVSPFMQVSGEYHFQVSRPQQQLRLLIEQYDQDQRQLTATQAGRQIPLNKTHLMRLFVRVPLLSFKVLAAIHWQALKIWLKRTPFITKPAAPESEIS